MNRGSWFWPDVSDLDGARSACRLGMWCAIVVAAVTSLVSILSLFGIRVLGASAYSLVDAALFAAIAFGMSRYSRFAAVAGFLLYLAEKILTLVATGSILGVGALGVVFLIGFLNAIRGSFAYHKLWNAAPPSGAAAPAP